MEQARNAGAVRGRYRTGEDTRRRLVEAGLLLFGRHGYDATATREICAQAEVAVPAIAYHFGGKEGLYLACADDIVARYRLRMGPALEAMAQALPAMPPEAARQALAQIVRLLLAMVHDAGEGAPWFAFMLREMAQPGPAHGRLFAELWSPGLTLVAALVAAARDRPAPWPEDRADALLLLSSLSALTTARRIALAFAGWPDMAPARAEVAERLERWIARL
jgi:TetR/AcrR family transcriptional regulator, regulator of cefoperazone and chloramphenicol sensitivity